jgi:hypothetical protein
MGYMVLSFLVVVAALGIQAGSLREELASKALVQTETAALPYTFSGTAPSCEGDSNCYENSHYGGYHAQTAEDMYWMYQMGFGANCWSGEKYVCLYDWLWVGTAPLCDPTAAMCPTGWSVVATAEWIESCDTHDRCALNLKISPSTYEKYSFGLGKACTSGTKLLCMPPSE